MHHNRVRWADVTSPINRGAYRKLMKPETCQRSRGWDHTPGMSAGATPARTHPFLQGQRADTPFSAPHTESHKIYQPGSRALRSDLNAPHPEVLRPCNREKTHPVYRTTAHGPPQLSVVGVQLLPLCGSSGLSQAQGPLTSQEGGVQEEGTVRWVTREGSENRGGSWRRRAPMGAQWGQR